MTENQKKDKKNERLKEIMKGRKEGKSEMEERGQSFRPQET